MANRHTTGIFQPIDRLAGRENYRSWATAMRSYLLLEELWDTIEAPTGGNLSTDATKLMKALARITLAVEAECYVHIDGAETPKDAWENLKKTYDDSSLTSTVILLQEVSTTKLENCKSMQDYISRIMVASNKLSKTDCKLPDKLVGALMLAGLPADYKPMIMALGSSGKDITADLVKSKLLEEAESNGFEKFETRGLYAQTHSNNAPAQQRWRNDSHSTQNSRGNTNNRGTRNKSQVRCFNCNKVGHFARKCSAPKRQGAQVCSVQAEQDDSEPEETICALLTLESNDAVNKHEWILDSGASRHMCCNLQMLINPRKPSIKQVVAANKAKVMVEAEGDILLHNNGKGGSARILLQSVLCVPDITCNLVSVSAIADKNFKVIFSQKECLIQDKEEKLVCRAVLARNSIYKLPFSYSGNKLEKFIEPRAPAFKTTCSHTIQLWHRRLGHLNPAYLKQLKNKAATGIDFDENQLTQCEICALGKQVKKPFHLNSQRASKPLELVHSDVCQATEPSIGNSKYFLTFLDDFSRKIFVYFLRTKDEVPAVVDNFIRMVENQTNHKVKTLRTDNGREYLNATLKSILDKAGIRHETTIAYNPQQNGRAERVNRVLLEKTRCMLVGANLPSKFWAEAVLTAAYLSNRSPKRCLGGKTPEELWSGKKPDLTNLRVFGCKAIVYVPEHKRGKMDPTGTQAIMLGYCDSQKGYRLWSVKDKKVFSARDVIFMEDQCTSTRKAYLPITESESTKPTQEDLPNEAEDPGNENIEEENVETNDEPENNKMVPTVEDDESLPAPEKKKKKSQPPKEPRVTTRSATKAQQQMSNEETSSDEDIISGPTRRSARQTKRPKRFDDYAIYTAIHEEGEPKNYTEAIASSESAQWLQAMREEIGSITSNKTWELCDLPKGYRPIGCKWVFKKKFTTDGSTRYKARLVGLGNLQEAGVNYDETYSPVVRFTSLRTLFAYAAKKDLDIYHLDIQTAFLHGDLEEIIYMQQPKGFVARGQEEKVCRLKKAIYGLKQGCRAWNQKLDQAFKEINLTQSTYDSCIYAHHTTNKTVLIAVFVDDIIVFTDSIDFMDIIRRKLSSFCTLKDLGPVQKCLGINVTRNKAEGTIELDQTDYIQSLLRTFGMYECRKTSTPMEISGKNSTTVSPEKSTDLASIPYQSAVGGLLYLVQATRPDLAYAVSTISRYNQSYDLTHWSMIKRIFRYLQGTKDYRLIYSKTGQTDLLGYCDASYAADRSDPRSVTGYTFLLQGGAVSWNSKRQTSYALSSTEAEYLSLSGATQEAVWLRSFCIELEIQESKPVTIFCDNKGAIDLGKNARFSPRTKHIDVRHHFIKEKIEHKIIQVMFTPSTEMIADPLTKATTASKLEDFQEKVGLKKPKKEV